jgi:hypothetical protein
MLPLITDENNSKGLVTAATFWDVLAEACQGLCSFLKVKGQGGRDNSAGNSDKGCTP